MKPLILLVPICCLSLSGNAAGQSSSDAAGYVTSLGTPLDEDDVHELCRTAFDDRNSDMKSALSQKAFLLRSELMSPAIHVPLIRWNERVQSVRVAYVETVLV